MSIPAGSSLGPYEVVSLLGAGGMGEVYRARDSRLDRIVAIKVLPAALSARPDLRQRLEREARTISSLTHPNICTLYDVGSTPDGSLFLVMEYIEGESLAERLARGALPLRQALRYGAEIADALDRAHRQGIVHRDLKPGNVMLTKSGVKLLDFGLAKLISSEASVVDPNSPTVQQRDDVTAEGTILGTLQYMSPEQLEGKQADARSDIFALGATLYEMLTGQRAFQANSRAAVIARILNDDAVTLTTVSETIPPQVSRIVAHCLMKEPDERWQTARDVAIQLRGAAEATASGETVRAPARTSANSWRRATAAAVLFAAGIAAMLLWQSLRPRAATQTPRSFTRTSIALSPDDGRLALAADGALAISRDGTKLVFLATQADGDVPRLYLRNTNSFAVTPLPGTEGATDAFFSPDGSELAFTASGRLSRLALDGGTTTVLAASGPSQRGSWGSDGMIIFNPVPGSALFKVTAAGGTPVPLLPGKPVTLVSPDSVPEKKLIFAVREVEGSTFDDAEIIAISTDTHAMKIVAHGSWPRYVPATGQLMFARAGKLWSVPLDADSISVRGTPTVVASPLFVNRGEGQALYDVSDRGDIVYAPFDATRIDKRLMLVNRDGTARALPFPPAQYESPHLSPDGALLQVEIVGADNDVWIADLARTTLNRVTSDYENLAPLLSPDGREIMVSRHRGGMPQLMRLRADGSGAVRPVAAADKARFAYSWSAAGTVAFMDFDPVRNGWDIGLLRLASGELLPLVATRFNETEPALSTDGRWLAYVSNETGQREVYVRATGGDGTKIRISADGGHEPLWSHGGGELFYRRGDAVMMVKMTLAPALRAGAAVHLFDFPGSVRDITRSYDVTPDDRQFVMIERAPGASTMRTLNVIMK